MEESEEEAESWLSREAEAISQLQSPFLQTLRDRGFLHQCTAIRDLDKLLTSSSSSDEPVSAYLGFDATADSLHVGSLLQIMILRHYQKSGHRPVVLIGGGTSKVGDPTGKDESRKLLDDQTVQRNMDGISKVFSKFLSFDTSAANTSSSPSTAAVMVNNNDWLSNLKYLDFLRDYGSLFTVNRMLSFESVKQRLEREAPFSFLEFNYMILQAYDFVELYRRENVRLQLGGSDQWGNIVSGTELGRRVQAGQQDDNSSSSASSGGASGVQLFGLTAPLITTSDGKKMGKTAGAGTIWLNEERLSPYDYWQFWRNTADADVIRFLKLFTELDLHQIDELSKLEGASINDAKIILADETTSMLHGRESLGPIHETIQSMFKSGSGSGKAQSTESLPRIFLSISELEDGEGEGGGIRFTDLFLRLNLATSKKDARRLIQGGGAKLGDVKIEDENAVLTVADFDVDTKEVTLRAGKKRAGVVELQ